MSKITAELTVTIDHADGSTTSYRHKVSKHHGDNPMYFQIGCAQVVADLSDQVLDAIGADFDKRAERRAASA